MQSPFLFVLLGLAVLIAVNPSYAANCTDYADCGDCTVQAGCGWCGDESSMACRAGNLSQPAAGNCTLWQWESSECSSICPPDTGCRAHKSCINCTLDDKCGWCSSKKLCLGGFAKGPCNSTICPKADPNLAIPTWVWWPTTQCPGDYINVDLPYTESGWVVLIPLAAAFVLIAIVAVLVARSWKPSATAATRRPAPAPAQ